MYFIVRTPRKDYTSVVTENREEFEGLQYLLLHISDYPIDSITFDAIADSENMKGVVTIILMNNTLKNSSFEFYS